MKKKIVYNDENVKWDKATHFFNGKECWISDGEYAIFKDEEHGTVEKHLTKEEISSLVKISRRMPKMDFMTWLKLTLMFFGAVIKWMTYKAKFMSYSFDGTKWQYRVYFVGRWYSPTFIIWAILGLILSVIDRGLLSGISAILYDLLRRDKGEDNNYSWSGEFRYEINWLRRRIILFRNIYYFQ